MQRAFVPAVQRDSGGGGSGLTLGTTYYGANTESASPEACLQNAALAYPSNTLWYNNTDATVVVTMMLLDSGLTLVTYLWTPGGFITSGFGSNGSVTAFVPPRTAYCILGAVGGGRTAIRVDALANDLKESDFHAPIGQETGSGSCINPGTGSYDWNGQYVPPTPTMMSWKSFSIGTPMNITGFAGHGVYRNTLAGIKAALGCS